MIGGWFGMPKSIRSRRLVGAVHPARPCDRDEVRRVPAGAPAESWRGVDRSEDMVLSCIRKGLSVFQGDLDEGLRDYPSRSYDYVILNQTLQMLHDPMFLLREMSRVGKRVIINFPNFGHYLNRFQLMFLGQMPVNKNIPYRWHNTPNIHFCTRKDFIRLCAELKLRIMGEICLNSHGKTVTLGKNVRASQVCMLLQGVDSGGA